MAYGAGANLALAGDFVLASHDARFCEIFVKIGLILDAGGTYFLPRLVGPAKAREIALLGEEIKGTAAESIGLIYRSFPEQDLDREAKALAKMLLEKPPAAISLIKEGFERSSGMSLRETLDWEAAHQIVMLQTKEHKAAVRRFLRRRGKDL